MSGRRWVSATVIGVTVIDAVVMLSRRDAGNE
jgi:hypothetical protein